MTVQGYGIFLRQMDKLCSLSLRYSKIICKQEKYDTYPIHLRYYTPHAPSSAQQPQPPSTVRTFIRQIRPVI